MQALLLETPLDEHEPQVRSKKVSQDGGDETPAEGGLIGDVEAEREDKEAHHIRGYELGHLQDEPLDGGTCDGEGAVFFLFLLCKNHYG